ncbi:MAG: conjugative transfer signal peptidase TraF [Pseudomonadota bacterium]|jgi:type IV secretory pathway protease TraF
MSLLTRIGSMGSSVLLFVSIFGVTGPLVVHTPSVPEGLYWRIPVDAEGLREGAYVCLPSWSTFAPSVLRDGVMRGDLPAEWKDEVLVKRVAAVAGELVDYREGEGVVIRGQVLPTSVALPATTAGRAMPRPRFPYRVRTGEVWLAATHPRGYDSRYMGAVDVRALSCIARPTWLW